MTRQYHTVAADKSSPTVAVVTCKRAFFADDAHSAVNVCRRHSPRFDNATGAAWLNK